MPMDLLIGAIAGWLVQLFGDAVVSAGSVRRKLRAAVATAVRTVLAEIPDAEARERLRAALQERFTEPPPVPRGDGPILGQWLAEAVSVQLSPLADPANAIGDRSYLEQIGVSHEWLANRLTQAIKVAVYEAASATDFGALATLLGIEDLRNELRRDSDQGTVDEEDVAASAVFLLRQQLPPESPPSFLLRSEYQIAPFTGRSSELAELTRWCKQEPRLAVGLVTAPGGQGKTRLAQELCNRLAQDDWMAGFVRPDAATADLDGLLTGDAPCLLVLDYAETITDQVHGIGQAIAGATAGRVRLLLLARSDGDWWGKLREDADDALAALLYAAYELPLPPLPAAVADRQAGFESARDAFSTRLGIDPAVAPPPPDLDRASYGLTLTLHMTALALLLDGAEHRDPRPAWRDPAVRILDHERRYWRRTAAACGLSALDRETLGHVVAAATLCSAQDGESAMRLLVALPDLADQPQSLMRRCVRWADALHPGAGTLNPLQPDRLGEDHIAEVLDSTPELAAALVSVADDHQQRRAMTTLARCALRYPHAALSLRRLLIDDPDRLLVPAMAAATQARDPQPLAEAIGAALPLLTDPLTLVRLSELLPVQSITLTGLAVQVDKALLGLSRRVLADNDPARGAGMVNLAARLWRVGELEEALAVAEHAVALLRPHVQDRQHRLSLARALQNLGGVLHGLGRPTEAYAAFQEAASAYKAAGDGRELHSCLSNLAVLLTELHDAGESIEYTRQAVATFRQLATAESPESQSELAIALHNHAGILRNAARYDEAVAAAAEAVEIIEPLAESRPDAFRDQLGQALDGLGSILGHLGRFEEALPHTEQAVEIFRALATDQPGRYQPLLRFTLSNHAGILVHLGRDGAAFQAIKEAVSVCLSLVSQRLDAHLAELSSTVNNLAATADRTGRHAEALRILRDAEQRYRQLASTESYGPRRDTLAAILTSCCHVLWHLNNYDEAIRAGEEAVIALRAGGVRDPGKLVVALASLAVAQGYGGQHEAAVESALAAAETCQTTDPISERSKVDVGNALSELAAILGKAERYRPAEECARLAVDLLTELARQNPSREPDLAAALHNHAVLLRAIFGTGPRWFAQIERAITIRRRWAEQSTTARHDLLTSMRFKAEMLRSDGLLRQAQQVSHEADAVERRARGSHRTAGSNIVLSPPRTYPGETVRSQPKVPRNAPCPCGSGTKFKRCCGSPGSPTR
jgi:tetratricopeptide (TPR) repeat protein